MKKVKKDFWEKAFVYPSFKIRFGFVLVVILILFFIITYWLYPRFTTISEKLVFLNLIVQSATLVLGIFAAYYALRQLVETRFINLEESGMNDLKQKHYLKAIRKWKEAFYIKPDAPVFSNLAEAFLLLGDFDGFDQHIGTLNLPGFIRTDFLNETPDRLTLLYLKSMRHLLVENLGEAKKILKEVVGLGKEENTLASFGWDFSDIINCNEYKKLTGESKIISDNLVNYLQKLIPQKRKQEFENGNFASQAID